MKNKLIIMAATVAAVVGFSSSVQATLISGGISLAGGTTIDTVHADAANVISFNNVVATGTSGNFVGITPLFTVGSITMNTLTVSPFVSLLPLWFVTANTSDSFDLTALTVIDRGVADALTLKGTGTFHLVGFEATAGEWTFTANSGGGTFSFSSSNSAIPDGGMTVLLLGAALTGLFLVRKQVLA